MQKPCVSFCSSFSWSSWPICLSFSSQSLCSSFFTPCIASHTDNLPTWVTESTFASLIFRNGWLDGQIHYYTTSGGSPDSQRKFFVAVGRMHEHYHSMGLASITNASIWLSHQEAPPIAINTDIHV